MAQASSVDPEWAGRIMLSSLLLEDTMQEFGAWSSPLCSEEVRAVVGPSLTGVSCGPELSTHVRRCASRRWLRLSSPVRDPDSEDVGKCGYSSWPQEPRGPTPAPHAPAGKVPRSQFWNCPRSPCTGPVPYKSSEDGKNGFVFLTLEICRHFRPRAETPTGSWGPRGHHQGPGSAREPRPLCPATQLAAPLPAPRWGPKAGGGQRGAPPGAPTTHSGQAQ